jgi:hypothetical protein
MKKRLTMDKAKKKKAIYSCTVTIYDDNTVCLEDKAKEQILVSSAVSKHLTLGLLTTMARSIQDNIFNKEIT